MQFACINRAILLAFFLKFLFVYKYDMRTISGKLFMPVQLHFSN